jgi:hypothetical protein
MILPCDLVDASRRSHDTASRWVALCPKSSKDRVSPRFTWPLDPGQAFGEQNFRNWTKRCVRARGLPVRIEWRERAGILLASGVIWDEDEYGYEDDDVPTLAEALLPGEGELYLPTADLDGDSTALERAIVLALEQPETVKNALIAVGDFLKSFGTPDELAQKRMAEYAADVAAARAAMAVENKIEEIMRKAGYDVDDDGEVVAPDEDQADELDDELVDDDQADELDDDELVDDELGEQPVELHVFEPADEEPAEQYLDVGVSDGRS